MVRFFILFVLCFTVSFSQNTKDVVESIGDGTQLIPPISALLLTVLKKDKKGTIKFAESVILTGTTVYILKNTIKKQRPDGRGYSSFPSGHTAASFNGAAFIQRRYGWKFGIPAYILATYTGFSRVYSDRHYIEDVFAGVAIGLGSVYLFTKPYKKTAINITYNRIKDTGFLIGFTCRF